MNQPITRTIFRWIHIICGIPILGYIYDSPSDTHNYAFSVRFLFLPVLLLRTLDVERPCLSEASFEETGLIRIGIAARDNSMQRALALAVPKRH